MTTYLRDITRIRSGAAAGDVRAIRDGRGALLWSAPTGYTVLDTLYDFEGGIAGWGGAPGTTGVEDVLTAETAAPIAGSQSLRITRTWSAGSDYQRARAPFTSPDARDWRGGGADALGALVLVPAGAAGTGWVARIRVQNGVGTVVAEGPDVPLAKGVVKRVWAPMQQDVLADVGAITVQVSASGVGASQHVLYDSFVLAASGATYEEPPPAAGGGTLWSTTFATADPKAELAIETGTEVEPGNLTFPTVSGATRARVSFPTVGDRRGYQGRTRFSDLGVAGQSEVELSYDVVLSAGIKAELQAGRDIRLPGGLAGVPDEQPGTYTSIDGVLRPDSWSAVLHLKAQQTTTTTPGSPSGPRIAQTFTTPTGSFPYRNASTGSHPDFWVESGSPALTVSGGIGQQAVAGGKYGRIMSNVRFGGPGKTVRVSTRMRASTIPGGVNGAGNAIAIKMPATQAVTGFSQDDPRSVVGGKGDANPGYFLFRHGVNSTRGVEIVRKAFGDVNAPVGESTAYVTVGRGPTQSLPFTEFRDVVIEFEWPDTPSGAYRFRLWINKSPTTTPTWSSSASGLRSAYHIPAFFWLRQDAATIQWDDMYVEEVGGGATGTTTTIVPAWAEATAYAVSAGGKTTEGDPFGLRFPLRRDLALTSSANRAPYWDPPSSGTVNVLQRIKVNTPGVADGEWDVWLDGTQYLRLRDVQWRGAGHNELVNQLLHEVLVTSGGGISTTGRSVELTSMRLADVTGQALPGAPTGLTVGTVTSTSVPLTWAAGSGADSHELLRGGVVIASGLGTSYTDSGRTPGTTYTYAVRAVNVAGKSALSASVNATTSAGTVTQTYLPGDLFTSGFAAKWTVPASARIDAGRGAIDYVANTYQRLITAAQDYRGKASSLEFVNVPPSTGTRHDLSVRIDAANNYEFIQFGSGTLVVQRAVGGATTQLFSAALDATAHRRMRIRETGGDIVFDVRSNAGAWVEIYREVAQINMAAAREAVTAYAPSGVTGTFLFDNNNQD